MPSSVKPFVSGKSLQESNARSAPTVIHVQAERTHRYATTELTTLVATNTKKNFQLRLVRPIGVICEMSTFIAQLEQVESEVPIERTGMANTSDW